MESGLLLLTCTCTAEGSFSQLHQLNEPQLAKLIRTQLVLVPDSPPKGGGGVWYSCMHSNLQAAEISETYLQLSECYLIALWHFTGA